MKLFRPTCAAALAAAVAFSHVAVASAFAPSAADKAENTPLQLGSTSKATHATSVTSGGSITRTLLALVVVIGLIYAVTVVLRRVKRGQQDRAVGSGLETVASVPLAPGRTLQLVRTGTEFVLVGVAENNVTPIRRYSEDEARLAGLITEEETAWAAVDTLSPRMAQNLTLSMGGDPVRRDASMRGVLDTLRGWTVRS